MGKAWSLLEKSKGSWAPKNWCFWTVVLEKTLEGPLDCKEIQPVHSKGDQSWVFFERNDAEAETPVLWPPHAKSWLIGKDSDAGRDWGQEEKGMTEGEMAGWHHRLDGHEFEWCWVGVGCWWWTGRPGVLWFMGSQRVGHDWATEIIWIELNLREAEAPEILWIVAKTEKYYFITLVSTLSLLLDWFVLEKYGLQIHSI